MNIKTNNKDFFSHLIDPSQRCSKLNESCSNCNASNFNLDYTELKLEGN